jgi:transketolase
VEVSTGSLGQGLSIAVGIALAAKLNGRNYKTFCIMGDGEQQEGQIWEAAMEAGHYKLDNLIGIVDKNRLQIDGWVSEVMNIDPLEEKYRSFGWEVMHIDGHDMKQVVEALEEARATTVHKPTLIVANTIKGKGVSFMEEVAGWHGKAPNYEEMMKGLAELGLTERIPVQRLLEKAKQYQAEVDRKLEAKMPKFSRNYWWNAAENMKAQMKPTRLGFGQSLAENGQDPAPSRSANFTPITRNARSAGSAWALPSSRRRRRRQVWQKKANCRSSAHMERLQQRATWIRFGLRFATGTSTC